MKKILVTLLVPLSVGLAVQEASPYKPFSWLFNEVILKVLEFLMYSITVPLWVIIIASIAVLILTVNFYSNKIYSNKRPLFTNYKTDTFFGIIWAWKWFDSYEGWEISDITSICPACKTILDKIEPSYWAASPSGTFKCCNCGFERMDNNGDLLHRVKREIQRKVNTKEYLETSQKSS